MIRIGLETRKIINLLLEDFLFFFLRNNLVSWFNRKQNFISLSTAEAEYIVVGSGCKQQIWMKNMLKDYGVS